MPSKKIDASNLYPLLRKRFPATEYALMQEVSDASGHYRSRSADYIAVGLWPSRGHYVIGMEVKSNRGDWLNELKRPQKAENIFQYCDNFYLVTTDETIAKLEELPATWGWITVRGNRLVTVKEAPKNKPVEIGRSFMCAMLKRACGKTDGLIHISEVDDRIEEAVERGKNSAESNYRYQQERSQELKKNVDAFEQASGLKINTSWIKHADIGKAVQFIMDGARNAVHALFTIGKNGDETEYVERMKLMQGIILNAQREHTLDIIPAITAICEVEPDARLQIQFLAAGYELAIGNNYTI